MTDEVDTNDDLSEGKIDPKRAEIEEGVLREEAQRRRWKTGVMWGMAVVVTGFYVFLIILILCPYEAENWHILLIVSAIPTAFGFSLLRLVSQPVGGQKKDDFDIPSPWLKVAKELIDTLKELAKLKAEK